MLERGDDAATVSVRDSGIGIDAADLDRLFRPFSRVRNRRTASIEGSGLGLYICDRIVRAHAGRMAVDSKPGAGSTFSFQVPLYGAAAQTRAPARAGGRGRRVDAPRGAPRGRGAGVRDARGQRRRGGRRGRAAPDAGGRGPRPRAAAAGRRRDRGAAQGEPRDRSVPLFALAGREDLGERSGLFRGFVPKPLDPKALSAVLAVISRERRAS